VRLGISDMFEYWSGLNPPGSPRRVGPNGVVGLPASPGSTPVGQSTTSAPVGAQSKRYLLLAILWHTKINRYPPVFGGRDSEADAVLPDRGLRRSCRRFKLPFPLVRPGLLDHRESNPVLTEPTAGVDVLQRARKSGRRLRRAIEPNIGVCRRARERR